MNKVSIIIPIYNSEKCIEKCLKSIINQTYKNIELILINDGSKDNTINILKNYEKKYSFVKLINKENEGIAKTRNLGIKKSTGKYIMFIDNDDYIDNDYVEQFVKTIEKTKSDVVAGGYRRENSFGKIISQKKLKNTNWSKFIIVAPWSKIYLKEWIIKNNVEFLSSPIGEDIYFLLKLISIKSKFYVTNYIGYTWYYNEKSISNTIHKGIQKDIKFEEFLTQIKNIFKNKDEYIKYFIYKFCVWYLLYSGKSANKEEFIVAYKKYFNWLKENNCYKTISPFSKKLKGESFRDRVCIFIFKMIDKLHVIKLFANIYCKGGKI